MKVTELLEVSPITRDKFIPKKREERTKFAKDQEMIGAGAFADVFSKKEEPGTVRKVVGPMTHHPGEDPYFKFVKAISKNQRFSGNPFLPQIFDLQVERVPVKDDDANINYYAYAVDMERLHPLDSLSEEEADMIGDQLIDDWDAWVNQRMKPGRHLRDPNNPNVTRKQRKGQRMYHGHEQYKTALFSFFKNLAMRKPYPPVNPKTGEKVQSTYRNIDRIKDSNLKQALLLIKHVMRGDSKIFNDMHAGNIMVRRGRGIPQLVITDPVA